MTKSGKSAKLAEVNAEASKSNSDTSSDAKSPKDRRTVAPTPDSVKKKSDGSSDDSVVRSVQNRAAAEAERVKDAAASHVNDSAAQFEEAGDAFDSGSLAQQATHRIADNLSRVARTVRDADLGSLQDDVSEFARRQPLLFFGGAALLGFVAARLIKATERGDQDFADSGDLRGDAPAAWGSS